MSRATLLSSRLKSALCSAAIVCILAPSVLGQITIPGHSNTYNGFSRGFNFTANTNFFINQLDLPLDAFQAGDTAGYMIRVNGTEVLRSVGNAGAISTNIQIMTGDVVDVIGNWSPAATGNFTAHNSYGSSAPFATTIEGVAHTLNRMGWQWDIGDASYLSGSPLTPGTGSMGRILVYTNPPAGLHSSFTATPSAGPTPLAVQFTDTTFTSDPGGVLTWAWDFESDGFIDSTIQNPQATYNTCGYYDVTLTTTDSMHPPSTKIERAFIQADPQLLVNANFVATPQGGAPPLQVQFTDASTGTPTSWSWDLDGDGLVDSTIQNPTFTYNTGGGYTVSLTVSNACGSDTETRTNFIFVMVNDECSGALPITFGANGPFDTSAATPSAPAWPCAGGGGPDLWFSFTPTCTGNVDIDLCGSGYDTALEIFSGGCGALTSITCNDDFCGLQSGLSLTPAVAGTTYHLRVGGYAGNTGSFVINVSINGSGSFSTIATGCGQATLDANGSPNIGGSVSYTMNGLLGTPLIWVGMIPLNNPLCPAGCALGTTFDIVIPAQSISAPIPCLPFIQGAVFYVQGADLNATGGCMPPVAPLPMTFTDTVVTTIG